MKLCISGLGYIEIPKKAMFGSKGVYVNGVEAN